MKFFAKLYLWVLLILTVSLSIVEYLTINTSFANAFDSEVEGALKEHQIVKYAIQADMLTMLRKEELTEDKIEVIVAEDKNKLNVEFSVAETDSVVEGKEHINYAVNLVGGRRILTVSSVFSQSGYTLALNTERDITKVYEDAWDIQGKYKYIFLFTEIAGGIFALIISIILTRPIRRLSKASKKIAEGQYETRVKTRSKDEVGSLARNFNSMAETIEEKVDDLELAAKQKDDFVANFAHELKTPMTSIIGYADTIYQGKVDLEQSKEYAGFILNEGLRLEALSFKLLELITLNKHKYMLEEAFAPDIFEDIFQTILPAAKKRDVMLGKEAEDGYVAIEYDLFKTMMLNILDNALKSGANRVYLSGQVKGNMYEIRITDNGRGIPKEELNRLTEAFYMVDKSRSRKEHGAGLGLALCAKIAEIHNTKLEINSILDRGTTISFKMQIREEAMDDE